MQQLRSAPDRASLAEEQAALRRVATLVAEGAPPKEVLDAVAVEVGRLIGADLAVLSRYDQGGGVTILASRPDGTAREPPFPTLPTIDPESLTAAVLRTGLPARVDDYAEASGPWAAQALELGHRSAVGAPVMVQGRLWGAMIVISTMAFAWPLETEDRLAEFTELVALAIANAESRRELRLRSDEQAALRRVATLVARGVSQSEVLDAVAREVNELLDAGATTVLRFEGTEAITVVASYGDFAGEPPIGTAVPLDGESVSTKVLRTGRPARVESFEGATGTIPALARELGIRSAVGAPIAVEGRLWVVTVGFCHPEPPPDVEHRLAAFTELAAAAIANAESREELAASEARARELADEQVALRRVATLVAEDAAADDLFAAVAREVADLFGAGGVNIDRYEDGQSVVLATFDDPELPWPSIIAAMRRKWRVGSRWPLDGGLRTLVYETGGPARLEGVANVFGAPYVADAPPAMAEAWGTRSGVAVPIVVNGEVWGVLGIFSKENEPLPPDTEQRLTAFTELVATSIANSESRGELAASEGRARELAEEQAALRRVATAVAQGAAPGELFSLVAKEATGVLGIPRVAIDRYEADGTLTILGIAGETSRWIGTRWPVRGVAEMTLASGQPSRQDDEEGLPAQFGDPVRDALTEPWREAHSAVGVPIVVDGGLWGLAYAAANPGTPLAAGTEDRLARFTELLATAIANAESRADLAESEARARELADEQAALRRVATLVARGTSPDELFTAVAEEVAGLIGIPLVGVYRYGTDKTFTTLGHAGDRKLTVGSRWPVVEEGLSGIILATGRPARKDNYSTMPGPVAAVLRKKQIDSAAGVPIMVDGNIWGFVAAMCRPGESLPADTEHHLERFTELVATGVSNATVRADLIASRARVVGAADETRRRLERDLHDGIQQWLVALALRARKAAGLSEGDSEELSSLADDLVAVTDELRELSRGIHPAILSDAGLDDALKALVRRSAIPVDLEVSFQGRYDPALEATVYYVAAESITNAVKHAQASTVMVRGGQRDGAIELEITDDGVGGADQSRGSGLIGLKDRVDTLGGTISIASPPGAGTTICMTLPVPLNGADSG